MKRDYIRELCTRHIVCDYEGVRKEYLKYKAKNIDTLDYVGDAMLAVYEHAFFSHFTKTKLGTRDLPPEVNARVLKAALEEVRRKYVCLPDTKDKGLVCNLYSVTSPPPPHASI